MNILDLCQHCQVHNYQCFGRRCLFKISTYLRTHRASGGRRRGSTQPYVYFGRVKDRWAPWACPKPEIGAGKSQSSDPRTIKLFLPLEFRRGRVEEKRCIQLLSLSLYFRFLLINFLWNAKRISCIVAMFSNWLPPSSMISSQDPVDALPTCFFCWANFLVRQ